MEQIKVGEYVRTNRWIGKIEEIKTTYVRMNGNHDKSYKLDIFNITDRDDVADIGNFAEDENARFFEIIIHGLIEGLENWYYDKW